MKTVLGFTIVLLVGGCTGRGTATLSEEDMARQRGPISVDGARWQRNYEPWHEDRTIHAEADLSGKDLPLGAYPDRPSPP